MRAGIRKRELCPFNSRAPSVTGGLHGPVAFPRERYTCSGGPPTSSAWHHHRRSGLSATALHFRPSDRRRIAATSPLPTYRSARSFEGFAGLSYFLARDGTGTPVEIRVFAGDRELGRHEHHDEWGWRGFEFSTGDFAGTTPRRGLRDQERAPVPARLLLHRGDLLMEPLSRTDRLIALGLAAAYVACLLASAGSLGYARDEGF